MSLVFSRDTDNLPITQTRTEYRPCMDSLHQSTSMTQDKFYPTEFERGDCPVEPNTNLTYDPRYIESGL